MLSLLCLRAGHPIKGTEKDEIGKHMKRKKMEMSGGFDEDKKLGMDEFWCAERS